MSMALVRAISPWRMWKSSSRFCAMPRASGTRYPMACGNGRATSRDVPSAFSRRLPPTAFARKLSGVQQVPSSEIRSGESMATLSAEANPVVNPADTNDILFPYWSTIPGVGGLAMLKKESPETMLANAPASTSVCPDPTTMAGSKVRCCTPPMRTLRDLWLTDASEPPPPQPGRMQRVSATADHSRLHAFAFMIRPLSSRTGFFRGGERPATVRSSRAAKTDVTRET